MTKTNRSFTIMIKPTKRTGHSPRPTGAGVHEDKRTKRNRTRQQQNRKAIQTEKSVDD